ncbi:MAG: hypothetical protein V1904_11180 [Bacteroidota bacterium]
MKKLFKMNLWTLTGLFFFNLIFLFMEGYVIEATSELFGMLLFLVFACFLLFLNFRVYMGTKNIFVRLYKTSYTSVIVFIIGWAIIFSFNLCLYYPYLH